MLYQSLNLLFLTLVYLVCVYSTINYDPNGRTIIDPDEEVQHAVSTLFSVFRTSGSAYGVVRYFAENSILFPKRAYGGAWDGKLTWGTLTHSRVLSVIHNPAYTGAYVYGRYRDNKTVNADGHFEHHPVRLPDKEEWRVFIPGHHQAYISWDDFEANQKQLCSNQTNTELCDRRAKAPPSSRDS